MKKLILILLLNIFLMVMGHAQVAEKVQLMTDRSVYFAGDKMLFYADLVSETKPDCPDISTVLYTEVLDQNGVSIVKKKTLIEHCHSSGLIDLPQETITGVYILRSYTKFQRNLSPNALTSSVIRIINPSQKAERKAEVPALERFSNSYAFKISIQESDNTLGIEALDKTIQISALSVVREKLAEHEWLTPVFKPTDALLPAPFKTMLPETRGVDIRGKLVLKPEHKKGVPILVYAATLGDTRQFHAVEVDSIGNFMVSFSQITGTQKIYISSSLNAEILVETDFSSSIPSYHWTKDTLYKKRLNSYNQAYINSQLPEVFTVKTEAQETPMITLAPPFTNPTEHIVISDFVPLKNLEEAFGEIVPFVFVRKTEGKRRIRMYDFKTKNAVENPLILVDNIAYQNHEQVLKIPISKVFAIDVFAEPLLLGDQLFEGIVNIKTEEGLLGGLALPNNCVALDYQTAGRTDHFQFLAENKAYNFGNTVQFKQNEPKSNRASVQIPLGIDASNYDVVIYFVTEFGELKSRVIHLDPNTNSEVTRLKK